MKTLIKHQLILLLAFALPPLAGASINTNVWQGFINNRWGDGNNWSDNVVPGPSDTARITGLSTDDKVINLNGNFAIEELQMETRDIRAVSITNSQNTLSLSTVTIPYDPFYLSDSVNLSCNLYFSSNGVIDIGSIVFLDGDFTSAPGVDLVKQGEGRLFLRNNNASFSKRLTIAEGPVQVTQGFALQHATVEIQSDPGDNEELLYPSSSNIRLGGLAGSGVLTLPSGSTLEVGGNNDSTTYTGSFGDTNVALIKVGSGKLTLGGANTFDGLVTLSGGTLAAVNGSGLGVGDEILFAGGALGADGDFSLSRDLTFSSPTTIGVIDVTNSADTLVMNGPLIGGDQNVLTKTGPGAVRFNLDGGFTGRIDAADGRVIAGGNALSNVLVTLTEPVNGLDVTSDGGPTAVGAIEYLGAIDIGSQDLHIGGGNRDANYLGVLTGSGIIFKRGSGVQTLRTADAYTGRLDILGGQIRISTATSLRNASVRVLVNQGLDLNGFNARLGALAGTQPFDLGSQSITIGGNNSSRVYSGVISGSGGITKEGTGAWTLNNNNTYTGPTVISSGALRGTGSVAGALTVQSGGALEPGPNGAAGTFNASGNVTMAGTYFANFDGSASDLVVTPGQLDLTGATLDIDVLTGGTTEPIYVIATYGSLTGTFASTIDVPGGYTVVYGYNGNSIALISDSVNPTVTAVTPAATTVTNASTLDFTVTFSEVVVGFDALNDLVLGTTGSAGATGATFSGGGSNYVVTLTGVTDPGTLTLTVNTNSDVTDYVGNPLASTITSAPVNLISAPVLYWPLEEGAGSFTAELSTGATNVAVLTGTAAWGGGAAPDSALGVDMDLDNAASSYVDAGTLRADGAYVSGSDPGYRVLNDNWTVSAWVLLEDPQGSTGDRVIISSDANPTDGWTFFVRDTGVQEDLSFDFGGARVHSGLSLPTGQPLFVALTADNSGAAFGGGNKHRFAVWDGSSWQTSDGTAFSPIRLQGLEIGSFATGLRVFDGLIDDVRLYRRTLTQVDLDALIALDSLSPSVTGIVPETTGPTTETSVDFEVAFSEPVNNFNDLSDLVITTSGSANVAGATFTGVGSVYTVTLSGLTGDGTVSLAVDTGSDVQDLVGNPLSSSVTSAAVTISSAPLLRWAFEEGAGTNTTETTSGLTDVAFLSGPVQWTNGIGPDSISAIDVDLDSPSASYVDAGTLGTNGQYVAGSDSGYRVLEGNWTVAAWVRLESPQGGTGDRVIVSSDFNSTDGWLFFGGNANGHPNNLSFDFGSGRVRSDLNLPLSQTVFVAILGDSSASVFGGGTNKHRFAMWDGSWHYSDGTQFANIRLQGLEIGSFANGQRQFDGIIDDVRIYDRTLTQSELDEFATHDIFPPSVSSITPSPTGPTTASEIDFNVIFDEPVTGFDLLSDLVITTTGTAGYSGVTFTGFDDNYTVAVQGLSGEGGISLSVSTISDVRDLAGNPLAATVISPEVLIDRAAPVVTNITPVNLGPVNFLAQFTVNFSEPVTNFHLGDDLDILTTGTVSVGLTNISQSNTVYTIKLAGLTGDGTLQLAVATNGTTTDLLGNPVASSVVSAPVLIDTTAPEIVHIIPETVGPTNGSAVSFNVLFNEPVNSFDHFGDLILHTTGTLSVSGGTVSVGNSTNYDVTLTGITGEGTVAISVVSNLGVKDTAGNLLLSSPTSAVVTVDGVLPEALTVTAETTGPTNAASLSFDVTFSEDVVNFDSLADLDLNTTGSANALSAVITGSGTNYTATLTSLSGSGTIAVSVNLLSDVQDLAGNGVGATATSAAVSVDYDGPQATSIVPEATVVSGVSTLAFDVFFDEPVTGFDAFSDLSIGTSGTATATGATIAPTDPNSYTVTLTGVSGHGTLTLAVAIGSGVQDALGNLLSSSVISVPVLLTIDPVLHWPLEEGGGSTTREAISGATDVAALLGAVLWTNELASGSTASLSLDNDSPASYVDAGTLTTNGTYVAGSDPGYQVLQSNWTVTAWVRLHTAANLPTNQTIASSDSGADSWRMSVQSGELHVDFGGGQHNSGITVPAGQPVFIAVLCDESASVFGFGLARHRMAVFNGLNWAFSDGIEIGGLSLQGLELGSINDGLLQLEGVIDDVRIYDQTLSQAELDGLATPAPVFPPPPPYETWMASLGLFGELAAFDGDADGDGGKNGYEWGTGTDASDPGSLTRLTVQAQATGAQIGFTRNPSATDVVLSLQVNTDLTDQEPGAWTTLFSHQGTGWIPQPLPGIIIESGINNPVDVLILDEVVAPVSDSYYRLEVSQPVPPF